ncbi:unnamed protein product, partial [Didymodactylos carnosus]
SVNSDPLLAAHFPRITVSPTLPITSLANTASSNTISSIIDANDNNYNVTTTVIPENATFNDISSLIVHYGKPTRQIYDMLIKQNDVIEQINKKLDSIRREQTNLRRLVAAIVAEPVNNLCNPTVVDADGFSPLNIPKSATLNGYAIKVAKKFFTHAELLTACLEDYHGEEQ